MSLLGSLQLAGNTLQAVQIGLQVTGNNIANANTPGFIRERVVYSPAPVQELGGLTLGLGVQIDGIIQQADQFLNERLRNASGDRAGADVQNAAYQELETLISELSDSDLSTSFSNFFNSIADVATNLGADSASFRNLAIGRGETLAADINRLFDRAEAVRSELDARVGAAAGDINRLTETIRLLNVQISTVEGGTASVTQAGSLRTERDNALAELAEIVDITVNEQPSGGVNISLNGEFLVADQIRREVETVLTPDAQGREVFSIQYADNNAVLVPAAGELSGLTTARDNIIGDFQSQLDSLAATLAFEFNSLYSQGQGQIGFQTTTSVEAVDDPAAPLDAAGLPFTPTSGSFQILLQQQGDSIASPTDIFVNLDGLDTDTSLTSLTEQIDAIDGISASINSENRLTIATDSPDAEFFFAEDPENPSGVLAALGLNTFFTGDTASTIGINNELQGIGAANRFAAALRSANGDSNGNENALRLEEFLDRPLDSQGGVSLAGVYDQLINDVTRGATVARSVAEGFQVFEATLEGEQQALGGVSIDEEAIQLIQLQRIFQASGRFIQSISELLDVLVNL